LDITRSARWAVKKMQNLLGLSLFQENEIAKLIDPRLSEQRENA
jgi:hypothetical protein